MPAPRSPAPQDAVAARRILLTGLAKDAALPELLSRLEPLQTRNDTFPGEVFLRLAADALAWSGVSPADPLPLEAMRERFLPEYSGRGRDRRKLQYAVLAAAALHGGAEPDLLDEVAWWPADNFWHCALLAAAAGRDSRAVHRCLLPLEPAQPFHARGVLARQRCAASGRSPPPRACPVGLGGPRPAAGPATRLPPACGFRAAWRWNKPVCVAG